MTYPELDEPLYHGSTVQVNTIDLSKSSAGKDFGRGFYTTTSRIQADKFALIKGKRIHANRGFVSVFQYDHNPELRIKKFDRAGIEWLLFVLGNRGFPGGQKPILDQAFDIVIGPVANDAVGLVLNQLLIGTYGDPQSEEAQNMAIRLLDTDRLYNQVFFGTQQGVSCLKFREVFEIGID